MQKMILAFTAMILWSGSTYAAKVRTVFLQTGDAQTVFAPNASMKLILRVENRTPKTGAIIGSQTCTYRHTVIFMETLTKEKGFEKQTFDQLSVLNEASAQADNDINELMKYIKAGDADVAGRIDNMGEINLVALNRTAKNPDLKILTRRLTDNIIAICGR